MLNRIIILSFSLLFSFSTCFAQDSKDVVKKINNALHAQFPDYHQLEEELVKAKGSFPNDLDIDYLLAIVMLEQSGKSEALPYVKNVIESGEKYIRDFDFYRAFIEQRNQNFDEAKKYYELFKSKLSPTDINSAEILSLTKYLIINYKSGHANSLVELVGLGKIIDNKIKQCTTGKSLVKNKHNVLVTNMGYDINSNYDEYSPVYSAIDTTLYFTSRRPIPDHLKKDIGDELFLEHIFEADKKSGFWSKSRFESEPLNSFTHNVSALAINREGNDMFIFDYRNSGDIMHSLRIGDGKWSTPTPFSPSFNSTKAERSFAISDDGKLAILERDGNLPADRDLFYSNFNGTSWSIPKNMGNVINTEFAEDGVFLHNNGKVLYFSSKGHNSMGGYDVFKSVWQDTAWSEPVNLGYPINTVYDDIYFIISDDESFGFISSNRSGGSGGFDIYHLNFKPDPIEQVVFIKVVDQDNGSFVQDAEVNLVDMSTNLSYPMKKMPDGSYQAKINNIEQHTDYKITAKKENFVGASTRFSILDSLAKYNAGKIYMKEIKQEIVDFVFNDEYLFDLNSSKFFEKYHSRLDVLINALNEYNVVILIEGFTDNSGSEKYNLKLSEKRAEEVRQYLIDKGVKPEQIVSKGYGESKPKNDNSTKELRDLNRRVTVSLVK